jgi:hypothetical protein
MATLASTVNRIEVKTPQGVTLGTVWNPRGEGRGAYRLRPLPNEDVYFYSKRMDNSRLARQADPRVRRLCWGWIGRASMVGILLVIMGLPQFGNQIAGYRLETLKREQQRLADEYRVLEAAEARLASPERLQELAAFQELVDPAPTQVIYLNPKDEGSSLAMNSGPEKAQH